MFYFALFGVQSFVFGAVVFPALARLNINISNQTSNVRFACTHPAGIVDETTAEHVRAKPREPANAAAAR